MAFPTTGILDNFDRVDEGPPPSASWQSGGPSASSSSMKVTSNAMTDPSAGNGAVWGTSVGPDTECYITASTIIDNLDQLKIWLRLVTPGSTAVDGYQAKWLRDDSKPGAQVSLFRIDNNVATQLGTTFSDTGGTLASGNKFGADMVGSTITAYINRGSWVSETSNSGDTTYTAAGFIALSVNNNTNVLDDFGGGTVVSGPNPPLLGQPPARHARFGPF